MDIFNHDFQPRVLRSQYSVLGLKSLSLRVHITPPRLWVDHPHESHAKIYVIANVFLDLARAVVFGEDLDAQKRRRVKHLLIRFAADVYANVRKAEPGRFDLHPLLGEGVRPMRGAENAKK